MRAFAGTVLAIWGMCVLVGCESAGNQFDGVSRFAGTDSPDYRPGRAPREPPAPLEREFPDGGTGGDASISLSE